MKKMEKRRGNKNFAGPALHEPAQCCSALTESPALLDVGREEKMEKGRGKEKVARLWGCSGQLL
jgi:hypothetical protein